jgi:hypothetical protein
MWRWMSRCMSCVCFSLFLYTSMFITYENFIYWTDGLKNTQTMRVYSLKISKMLMSSWWILVWGGIAYKPKVESSNWISRDNLFIILVAALKFWSTRCTTQKNQPKRLHAESLNLCTKVFRFIGLVDILGSYNTLVQNQHTEEQEKVISTSPSLD